MCRGCGRMPFTILDEISGVLLASFKKLRLPFLYEHAVSYHT
jgi:hypothetical protein